MALSTAYSTNKQRLNRLQQIIGKDKAIKLYKKGYQEQQKANDNKH